MQHPAVLFLTTSFPSSMEPASGVFVARLAGALAAHVNVSVLAPAVTGRGCERWEGLPVKRFAYAPRGWMRKLHGPGGLPAAMKRNPFNALAFPGLLLSMAWYCRKEARKVDLVHAQWSVCGAVAALCSGRPVVVTLRGADIERAESSVTDRMLLRVAVQRCRRVFCVNHDLKQRVCALFPRAESRLFTVANGVGEEFFALPAPEPQSTIRIVAIGSLIPRKGFDLLIRAIATLRDLDWRLTIFGDGPDRSSLATTARESGVHDRVQFPGVIRPKEVARYLEQSDIFVCSSRSEGRPNVVLEAMAGARAVVAADIPGMREIVHHEHTGRIFAAGDHDALARELRALIEDKASIARLGLGGRRLLQDQGLTWEAAALKCIDHYGQVLESEHI